MPACASKRDVLELATLQKLTIGFIIPNLLEYGGYRHHIQFGVS